MSPPARKSVPLSLQVRGLPKSPTIEINERCASIAQTGREVFRLGLGQSPFPVPMPVVEALRENAVRKEYLPTRGLLQLREAVAEYHRRRHGTGCSADDVLIGPGSKELMFLLQVVYYGDLLIPSPGWVSYAPQAQIVGRQVQFLHTSRERGWKLDPEELDKACAPDPGRPRILVLNYPSNPTGRTYSADEVKALAEVAEHYGVVVLSDEIYAELHHRGEHVSIERVYPHGTIVSSGLSKWCGAGGWRLGTFAFPEAMRWLLEAMEAVASETFTSTSAPIQYAAVKAFQGGLEIERYLWHARHILGALGRASAARLRASGADVDDPEGAFYLFPDFGADRTKLRSRGIRTSADLCQRLLDDTGVAILPGSVFGRDPGELTARIAYVDFDGAQALAAAETLGLETALGEEYLRRYCGRTLIAIDRICEWLG
jgi:aspartate aminotransferase